MSLASNIASRSRLITASIGVLVVFLGLVGLISRIEPPMGHDSGQISNALPAQEIQPTFEIVRINQNGSAIFSGSATPGATVSLTLNKKPFVEIQADIHGDWIHTQGAGLELGQHIVRISAQLQGFADSTTDEQLLIDLEAIDPNAETALPNDAAIVFAASSARGLRVLQNHQLAMDLSNATKANNKAPAITETATIAEPAVVPVQDSLIAEKVAPTPEIATPEQPEAEQPEAEQPEPEEPVAKAKPSFDKTIISGVKGNSGTNTVTAAGSATPNTIIRANTDNNPTAETKSDAQGRWEMTIIISKNDRPNQLRAWQVIAGQVIDRRVITLQKDPNAATKQQTAPEPKTAQKTEPKKKVMRTVTVRKGDSLWELSMRVYKDGNKYTKLLAANKDQLSSHRDLKPGMVLKVPD